MLLWFSYSLQRSWKIYIFDVSSLQKKTPEGKCISEEKREVVFTQVLKGKSDALSLLPDLLGRVKENIKFKLN